MKKNLLFIFFVINIGVHAQSVYFKTGVNNTNYHYKSELGEVSKVFQSQLGDAYEIGYRFPLSDSLRFSYEIGLVLNEYNAIVGVPNASIKWKTDYVGIQSTFICPIVKLDCFTIDAKAGGGLNTILYGKQDLNGIVYDLKKNNDFEGVVFHVLLGLQANLKASEYCHLSIGYNYSNSISSLKSPQKFSFETNQIMFGIHLTKFKKIDKKEKNNL
ncbi:hypothetical protein ACM55I_09585 [Flavobacterium sp. GB2R13]|uniref:hypothetical protein n=1 Tax=Flavobacterium algoris TaxID=3398733 RepID=UPI003A885F32